MMKSQGRFILLYIIIGVNLLVGCGRKAAPQYVIGVSQCSKDFWRDKFNKELQMAEYLNDSIQVKLASSNDDSKLQTRQINQMIDEKVDLLVIAPNQLNTISPAINRAYDKGIPVIIYDRKANSNKYTAFIGCDNYAIGKSMGEFIAQKLQGKGRVVEIRGLEGASSWFHGSHEEMSGYAGGGFGGWRLEGGEWQEGDATHPRQDS